MKPLAESLRRTVEKHHLIVSSDRILAAVSGGPDSLALLHALIGLKAEVPFADLQAAHLDHGLRGIESTAEAEFVAAWCAAHSVPCILGKADLADVSQYRGMSRQEAARAARYRFLESVAERIGATKIATGHTLNDQTETVLLNILRGTGLTGLIGIRPQRGQFIRPLIETERSAVEAYCTENFLEPRRDPSNFHSNHYTRNRIRLELLPLLERDYHSGVSGSLLRLSEIASRDAHALQEIALAALPTLTLQETDTAVVLDARQLQAMHPALQRYLLRAALDKKRGSLLGITYRHLESLCEALAGAQILPFGLTTPQPSCTVRVTQRRVTITRTTIPAAMSSENIP